MWLTTLLAPLLAPPSLCLIAVLAGGAAPVIGRRVRGAAGGLLLAVLAGLAVTSGVASVRGAAREVSPLRAAAEAGRGVLVTLTLHGDPRVVSGAAGPRVIADATVSAMVDGGTTQRLDAPVLLFAPAAGWQDLAPGQTVQVRAGVSPPRTGDDVVAVLSARGPPSVLGGPGPIQRAAGVLRDGLAASAARTLDERPAGLLPGLVVGDTRAMDPLLTADFRRAGLSHLTAVSGANVAIVLTGILWPLRRRAVRPGVQVLVAGLGLAGFVVLARPGPSVVRAAAMGAITLMALAAGRPRAAVPALAASVCVLLTADPGRARDAGFTLSVAATAAIVVLARGWSRRLQERRWPRLLADAVAVSAAAGVATAPLVAALSGAVSLSRRPRPAGGTGRGTGHGARSGGRRRRPAAATGRRRPRLAGRLARALAGAGGRPRGRGPGRCRDRLAGRQWGSGAADAADPGRRLGVVAVPAAAPGRPGRGGGGGRPGLAGTADDPRMATAGDRHGRLRRRPGRRARAAHRAGPGNPGGRRMGVTGVDRCLDRLGIDTLPLVLLSHLDADHAGGLAGALAGRHVGAVDTGTLSPADTRVGALDRLVRRARVRRAVLLPGYRQTVGTATVEVLVPAPEWATASATPNDLCLLVRITVNGLRLLLTGDLSATAEARILAEHVDLRADVLKVPHHGSADTDPDFLAATVLGWP